jgi:membrane protein implicated in regulation of membrane protease activity
MKALTNVTNKLYTWITLIALSLGLLVALLFLTALIIGGSAGESLAVFSGDLMTWSIRLATIAVLAGIINIYASKRHTLTMDKDPDHQDEPAEGEDKTEKHVVS